MSPVNVLHIVWSAFSVKIFKKQMLLSSIWLLSWFVYNNYVQCMFEIPQALLSFTFVYIYSVFCQNKSSHFLQMLFSLSVCLRRFSVYCWLLAGVTQGTLQIILNAKIQKLNISIKVKSTYHIWNSTFIKSFLSMVLWFFVQNWLWGWQCK